jgi:hypothetical protein
MFKELERQSLREKSSIVYPNIPFVNIKGKKYSCLKCGIFKINRGSMSQHIEGNIHKLNWKTGESLTNKETLDSEKFSVQNHTANQNQLFYVEKYHSKESFEMVKTMLEMKDREAARFLAKYFTDGVLGVELYDFIRKRAQDEIEYEIKRAIAQRKRDEAQNL